MKKVICYQLELGKYNFAVISTKCSSFHQGESEEVRTSTTNFQSSIPETGDMAEENTKMSVRGG